MLNLLLRPCMMVNPLQLQHKKRHTRFKSKKNCFPILMSSTKKIYMDIKREIERFKEVYEDAMYAPLLKWNLKYKTEDFDGMTPYICIKDICDYNCVVCAIPNEEVDKQLPQGPLQELSRRKVIAEYNSIEEMVKDGWRLD